MSQLASSLVSSCFKAVFAGVCMFNKFWLTVMLLLHNELSFVHSFYKYKCVLEVVEHCCSITSLQLGETMTSVAKDMDTLTYRYPLGVCAGITPFNFPAMIPLWVSLFSHYLCVTLEYLFWQVNVGVVMLIFQSVLKTVY